MEFAVTIRDLQRAYPKGNFLKPIEELACRNFWIYLTECGKHHWNHVKRMGGGVLADHFGVPKKTTKL